MKFLIFALGSGETAHGYAIAKYLIEKQHQVVMALLQEGSLHFCTPSPELSVTVTLTPEALQELVDSVKPNAVILCNSKSFRRRKQGVLTGRGKLGEANGTRKRPGRACMKKAKTYTNVIKRFYRPEIYKCLDCHKTIKRAVTIGERIVVTLDGVLKVTHGGYRCKNPECSAKDRTYRSAAADALVLPKRTFGLDIIFFIGYLRLKKHQTMEEIYEEVSERLKEVGTSISQREIMYLFDDFCCVMRAASDAAQDEEWKEQVRKNGGMIVSIDGIQPDKGNETVYIVRDALTGRMIAVDNATESSTDRLKEILQPVVKLGLPVIGTISDSQKSELLALTQLFPDVPHQVCHFHVLRDAGQGIFAEDKAVKTAVRQHFQTKTRNLRKQLKAQIKQAAGVEAEQLAILDEYVGAVQATVNRDGLAPFDYAGIESFDDLDKIAASVETLDKKGGQ